MNILQKFVKPADLALKYPKLLQWNPVSYGLSPDFAMTNFTELKGCGCKVPQAKLLRYLEIIGQDIGTETPDVSVVPINGAPNHSIISTIDFFYPLVENPYAQGRIACCNVLSDLYAMGVTRVDNMLMVLGVSTKMTDLEKEVSTSLMIQGFNDCAAEAQTSVTGGQSVQSPWPQIGGVGISGSHKDDFIMPVGAKAGDYLVLTKPLGAQIAVNTFQWMNHVPDKWDKIKKYTNTEELTHAFNHAQLSMATLNLAAASLFKKHNIRASTDITGFGILGHATYLSQAQKDLVTFKIHTLPTIANLFKLEKLARDFGFIQGKAAETSGGLLVAVKDPQAYIEDYRKLTGQWGWVIGEVVASSKRSAEISSDVKILEV